MQKHQNAQLHETSNSAGRHTLPKQNAVSKRKTKNQCGAASDWRNLMMIFFLICLCFEPGVFLGLKTSVVDYFPPSPDFWQMVHHFHLSSPLTSSGIVFLINSEQKLESRERWFLYSGLRLIFLLGSELLNSGRADRPSGSGETATWKRDGGCHHF